MKNQEFSLYDSMERTLSRWWIIVVLMILGGMIGWVFHYIYPPIFDAKAVITINMDFEKRQLTQFEEDTAFGAAGAVITSSDVKNLVIADAKIKGYSIDLSRIQDEFFSEGKQSVWELRVRNPNSKAAADLVNIWAEKATKALNVALTHALQADQIQLQIGGLEKCLTGMSGKVEVYQLDCKSFSQEQIKVKLQERTDELVREKSLSFGIIPIMTIGLTESASVPEKPAIYNSAGLVLAGTFIGLVVSFWVINSVKVSQHE